MILSGADIICKVLLEQGSDVVFGYPGGNIINVYDSLYKFRKEIKHVLSAHEQGAVHAADGYARATGKVGVVLSTSGPGATNLVTGIATAFLDSIPLVAVCGNVATSQIGFDSFQELDITGVTLPITKHNYFVGAVEELADTLREAFRLAKSGRPGPVLVDVPKDVQIAKCEYVPEPAVERDPPFSPKEVRLEEAAACINGAKRPFIYFGGGVLSSGAEEEIVALADKIDAPLGCSLMGLSAVPSDQARYLGMEGMHGHYACTVGMQKADVIISLGVRFNDRSTGNKSKFAPNAKIVHIDVDGSELRKTTADTHGLRADLKKTLDELLPRLKEVRHPDWQKTIRELKAEEESYADRREGLTPKNILSVVNENLSDKTPLVTDVGQHQMWTAQYAKQRLPRTFLSSGGLGTMGFGLGAAIGAAIGTGERAVLVTGDGGFGMCLNELATAVTYKVPVTVLILNNGVLGMVRQWQTLFFGRRYSSTVLDRKTDFVALTKAFGGKGEKVESLYSLDKAFKNAVHYKGPYVIECAVDKDELVLPMLPPGGSMDEIIVKVGE
ncbi:MAG: biosynthetic-type acetolactate synthase large subunit [Clostridia bacterium]|nr:biosynthetic-type acetolactate synthase large subunit [Clostridia bacterium]